MKITEMVRLVGKDSKLSIVNMLKALKHEHKKLKIKYRTFELLEVKNISKMKTAFSA
jgi:hypothetical protein